VWRTLDELTPAAMKRVEKARATARRHVWAHLAGRGGLPRSRVADADLGDTVVLEADAILVTVHSEKESAAPTFKGGFGYRPVGVWCINTAAGAPAMRRAGRPSCGRPRCHSSTRRASPLGDCKGSS
jgi:hypothetical protein